MLMNDGTAIIILYHTHTRYLQLSLIIIGADWSLFSIHISENQSSSQLVPILNLPIHQLSRFKKWWENTLNQAKRMTGWYSHDL
jgi:hypothetical protein